MDPSSSKSPVAFPTVKVSEFAAAFLAQLSRRDFDPFIFHPLVADIRSVLRAEFTEWQNEFKVKDPVRLCSRGRMSSWLLDCRLGNQEPHAAHLAGARRLSFSCIWYTLFEDLTSVLMGFYFR